MWQSVVTAVLLAFGIFVAVFGIVAYLRMYRKQGFKESHSQDSSSDENQ